MKCVFHSLKGFLTKQDKSMTNHDEIGQKINYVGNSQQQQQQQQTYFKDLAHKCSRSKSPFLRFYTLSAKDVLGFFFCMLWSNKHVYWCIFFQKNSGWKTYIFPGKVVKNWIVQVCFTWTFIYKKKLVKIIFEDYCNMVYVTVLEKSARYFWLRAYLRERPVLRIAVVASGKHSSCPICQICSLKAVMKLLFGIFFDKLLEDIHPEKNMNISTTVH